MYTFIETLEFDLPSALLSELVTLLDDMPSEDLSSANLIDVPEAQGVYQLFFNGQLAYIGKTDAEAGLKKRLLRHCDKIKDRVGLHVGMVQFKAVRIFVFSAIDLETQLITHYKNTQGELEFQHSGFGANDPGRKRDTGKPGSFDLHFPIDIVKPFNTPLQAGNYSVSEVLHRLKKMTPYVVRFQRAESGRAPHSDLLQATVSISNSISNPKKLFEEIGKRLGNKWQITQLPGYVIIYKECKTYEHGQTLI